MANIVASATTALWILIELIQFGYMAYLMWRNKHNDINRYRQRVGSVAASA